MGTTDKRKHYQKIKRGDILYINLDGVSNGSVQGGLRPCIVISNDISNRVSFILNVFPLTTHFKECPVHVRITPKDVKGYLMKESEILAEQPMTVARNRVKGKIGFVDPDSDVMNQINNAVMCQLGCMSREGDANATHG